MAQRQLRLMFIKLLQRCRGGSEGFTVTSARSLPQALAVGAFTAPTSQMGTWRLSGVATLFSVDPQYLDQCLQLVDAP